VTFDLPASRVRVPPESTRKIPFPAIKYKLPDVSTATEPGEAKDAPSAEAGVGGIPPPAMVEMT
jgi:hypothetical protein